MTSIYIDYPVPHFAMKHGVTVAERVRHDKPNRRVISLTPETFSREILPFIEGRVTFSSTAEFNDLWLEIDFGDHDFEHQVGKFVQRMLCHRYKPFMNAPWTPV